MLNEKIDANGQLSGPEYRIQSLTGIDNKTTTENHNSRSVQYYIKELCNSIQQIYLQCVLKLLPKKKKKMSPNNQFSAGCKAKLLLISEFNRKAF